MNQKTHQIVLDSPFLERCIFCSHHLIHSCLYLPPLALWSSMWLLYDAWSKQLVVASVGGGWEWLFIFHSLSNATVADSDTCWVVQTETGKMKEIRRCEIFRFSCLNDSFTNGSVSLPTHVWLTIPYHHNNRQQCLHKFLVVNFRILQNILLSLLSIWLPVCSAQVRNVNKKQRAGALSQTAAIRPEPHLGWPRPLNCQVIIIPLQSNRWFLYVHCL